LRNLEIPVKKIIELVLGHAELSFGGLGAAKCVGWLVAPNLFGDLLAHPFQSQKATTISLVRPCRPQRPKVKGFNLHIQETMKESRRKLQNISDSAG